MTETELLHTHEGTPAPHHEDHEHKHPSDRLYVMVAAFLAAITALEVSTYFFDLSTPQLVGLLIPLMIIKFGTVCAVFMHLRYDNPIFSRIFLFGLILAVIVYSVALSAMEFWSSAYPAH
jgi:cytochrome c oxidase subunit 4